MASLTPTKIILSEINSGIEYIDGDSVQASTINKVIEGTAYADQKVEELEQSLILEKGTTVSVNSVPQNTLAFTSDPQTQLNDRIKLTTDQSISGNKKFIDTVYAEKIRGKNWFNINGTYTKDAVTYAINNNILTLTATSTAGIWAKKTIYLEAGNYAISCITNNTGNGNDGIIITNSVGTNIFTKYTASNTPNVDKVLSGTFSVATSGIYDIAFWISFSGSKTVVGDICQFKNIQIELGSTATPYTPYIGEYPTQKFVEDANPFKRSFLSGTSGVITLPSAGSYEFYGTDIARMSFGVVNWNGLSRTYCPIVYQNTTTSGRLSINADGSVYYYQLSFVPDTTGYALANVTITLYFRKID